MKTCRVCNIPKTQDNFYPASDTRDQLMSQCKPCFQEGGRLRRWKKTGQTNYKRVHIKQPADSTTKICTKCREQKAVSEFNKNSGKLRSMCRSCDNERQRNIRLSHPERKFRYKLARDYSMTVDRFNELFNKQGRCCAVCGRTEPTGNGWSVDHDHSCCPGFGSCGKCVRGILCMNCNNGLGCFRDSIELLRAGAKYLENTRTESVQDEITLDQVLADAPSDLIQ